MSKYLKDLMGREFARRLDGVQDALLVDVIGLDANATTALRRSLREKNIQLMVVKKSLASRALAGHPLAAALDTCEGSLALLWGSTDIVALAKEAVQLHDDAKVYVKFEGRGGVMDGEPLTFERVKQISKWPSRDEQLGLLVAQILGPGSRLAGALVGPSGALASQIKEKAGGDAGSSESESESGVEAAAGAGADAAAE